MKAFREMTEWEEKMVHNETLGTVKKCQIPSTGEELKIFQGEPRRVKNSSIPYGGSEQLSCQKEASLKIKSLLSPSLSFSMSSKGPPESLHVLTQDLPLTDLTLFQENVFC